MTPNLIPPPLAWLHHTWTLTHAREYAQAMHALHSSNTPFFYITPNGTEHIHKKTNNVI
jgi:hypothetical protein